MKRSGEEPQGGNNNIIVDEVQYYPRLNLPLTKTPELINLIESYLQQVYPCPQQKTSTCPKNPEKIKAMNFPISKITIGQWTSDSVYDDDIVAKFYFAKKKLLWEFLVYEKQETSMERLKRKIEIQWDDVSSLRRSFHLRDETGILEVELRKRPTFFMETNPQAGKHTQWKQIQDFTETQSSHCRRHTLHFKPGVLQKNFEKLVSSDSFWSELVKVPFPLVKSPYFDIPYENNNTISFNANIDFQQYHHFQGIGHVGEGNFNMTTHLWANDGMQINSYGQANSGNNIENEYRGMQATPPSSQVIYEHYNTGMHFTGSQCSNLMIQDKGEMQNREGLLGSQAYELPYTQTNLMMNQHMNEFLMYPDQFGSYLASTILQEGERQHMEYTHLGGNVQIDDYQQKGFNQSGDDYYYPYSSSNNYTYMSSNHRPVISDMKDDFNDEEI